MSWIGISLPYIFFHRSNGHDSPGNPSRSAIIRPVSRLSPVFPGPWWNPIHNATLGSPLPACNPSILSNQSALFQQEHISTVTEGGFTTSGARSRERKGREKMREKKVWEQSWCSGMEILDQHHVLPFTFDTGQRAGSQLSVLARCRVELYIDVLEGNICHCAPSQFLSSSVSHPH